MSRQLLNGYRFATEDQWNSCLFAGADRETKAGREGLRPFAPFGGLPARFESNGARAPAIGCDLEIAWRDDAGHFMRLPYADDKPIVGPALFAHAIRFVAATDALWTAFDNGALQAFERDSLTRRFIVDLCGVIDIAADGHDGVFVLFTDIAGWHIAHLDCTGRERSRFTLEGVCNPTALVYLAKPDVLVVHSAGDARFVWFAPQGGPPRATLLQTAIRPCFGVAAMGSDGRARIYLAGSDGPPFGGQPYIVTLDPEGVVLAALQVEEAPTGVTGDRTQLLVTTARGLLRFDSPQMVAQDSSDVSATLLTPMLLSPSTADRRLWLRAEATVALPEGSTLEIAIASTDEPENRDAILAIASDPKLYASKRIELLRTQLSWQSYSFHGQALSDAQTSIPVSAPLFDIHDRFLWLKITLIASPGGGIPILSELNVFYPGRTLMENLPGIYQRAEDQPGSFVRSLVGVVESTTQNLDARIGNIGRNINPETAAGPWLDFLAGCLGLPWDDALSLEQKRGVVLRAADIARGYGTKAGLEALLAGLIPGAPTRFRITDLTVQFGLSVVGGGECEGSSLPVILAGLPPTATELNTKAVLGRGRLPCSDADDGTVRLLGRIRVDISVTAAERAAWEPWLSALVSAMVPATTRVTLNWLSPVTFRPTMRLGDDLTLEDAPEPHLGTDAVTGIAHLPRRRSSALPETGLDQDTPLN